MSDDGRLIDLALEQGLVTPAEVAEGREILRLSGSAAALVEVLVNRGCLTAGQVEALRAVLAGRPLLTQETVVLAAREAADRPGACADAALGGPEQAGRFGRYEILERVSQGAMGAIYKVRDPELGRVLALKVLLAGTGASEDQLRRFQQEARATAGLQHRHIVPVHEVGVAGSQPYYTMDFIEGRALSRVIETERISWERACDLAAKVAEALAHA
ncbi:MAG: protein kinase, partial [Planctomycetes bacterium]|nr:protein kinase [Planctomycetota bacterium]